MRNWSCYLTLCLHSLTWEQFTVSLGLNRKFKKCLSKKGDISRLSFNYPSPPNSVGKGSGWRTVEFPQHQVFPQQRHFCEVQFKTRSFMLCFLCSLATEGFEQKITSRIRANKWPGKLVWYYCHWPKLHVDTKPGLLTHPLSSRDCLGQHP